jgi:hypothetical protein
MQPLVPNATGFQLPPGVSVTAGLLGDEYAQTLRSLSSTAIKSVGASYAALPTDETILYSGVMDGSQSIILPVTGISPGKKYIVKIVSADASGGPLNVNTSSSEYAGNPQLFTIPGGAAMGGCAVLVWDGNNWWLESYAQ